MFLRLWRMLWTVLLLPIQWWILSVLHTLVVINVVRTEWKATHFHWIQFDFSIKISTIKFTNCTIWLFKLLAIAITFEKPSNVKTISITKQKQFISRIVFVSYFKANYWCDSSENSLLLPVCWIEHCASGTLFVLSKLPKTKQNDATFLFTHAICYQFNYWKPAAIAVPIISRKWYLASICAFGKFVFDSSVKGFFSVEFFLCSNAKRKLLSGTVSQKENKSGK